MTNTAPSPTATEWSEETHAIIRKCKIGILKKKVLLALIVDSYRTLDRLFTYVHWFLLLTTPILLFVSELLKAANGSKTSKVVLVISTVSAVMMKLKDYLQIDKKSDLAKQQIIRYEQLLQIIELELGKPTSKQQTESDFLYWIAREFDHIELADPEASQKVNEEFLAMCKTNGIPVETDFMLLTNLCNAQGREIPLPVYTQAAQTIQAAQTAQAAHSPAPLTTTTTLTDCTGNDSTTTPPKQCPQESSHTVTIHTTQLASENSPESVRKADKDLYARHIRGMRSDTQWTMERLQNLTRNSNTADFRPV